jgi:hypothetical protein
MQSIFVPRLLDFASYFLERHSALIALLSELGLQLDLPTVEQLTQRGMPPLREKLDRASFIWISSAVVTELGAPYWEAIVEAVKRGKNLLVTLPPTPPRERWSGREAMQQLQELLSPVGMRPSEFKAFDEKNNWEDPRDVKFHRWNNCLHHAVLFEGVETVVIGAPRHLYLADPASPLITGNPTTRAVDDMDVDLREQGPGIVCAAWSQPAKDQTATAGKVVLFAGWIFNDPGSSPLLLPGVERPGIKANRQLATNTVRYLTP